MVKIYGVNSQEVKEITENQKNELVDLDLAWFDGRDWCFLECEETERFFNKKKSFKVSVTFECVDAKDPLSAAKTIMEWFLDDAKMVYEVVDEETNEAFTVDLGEEDEDAVLPKE